MRKRALDLIDFSKDKWFRNNPLFKSYMPELDECFNRGTPLDLEYYVERIPAAEPDMEDYPQTRGRSPVSYEDELCQDLFSPNPTGKIYLLVGAVGAGKTSLSRYLVEKKLPVLMPQCLAIYIDTYKIFYETGNEEQQLDRRLLSKIKNTLLHERKPFFKTERELLLAIMKMKGYENSTNREIMEFEKTLTLENLLDFLNHDAKVSHLLVIFDNMDEDSLATITNCQSYAFSLINNLRDRKRLGSCVMIPIRGYTEDNQFNAQDRYAVKRLPPVDEVKIVKAKFDQVAQLISKVVKDFTYTIHGVDHTKFEVVIDKASSLKFFQTLAAHLLSPKEPEVLELVRGISGGNLKILTSNMYNLIHSAKLPLIPLYKKIIFPKEPAYQRSRQVISFDLACECLIAIHYPFFDERATHVLNLFNANPRRNGPAEYQNTLVIFRILCVLWNNQELSYEKLLELFERIGYAKAYLDDGLKKCLTYGMITSNHGLEISHFDAKTALRNSECVKIYLERLIFEPGYLQYICEDVPMPPEYLVPIPDKYLSEDTPGCKERRLQGVAKFIEFVAREEELELENVKQINQFDVKHFMENMNLQGTRLSDLFQREVMDRLKKIRNA